jgi:hypothetical protein
VAQLQVAVFQELVRGKAEQVVQLELDSLELLALTAYLAVLVLA